METDRDNSYYSHNYHRYLPFVRRSTIADRTIIMYILCTIPTNETISLSIIVFSASDQFWNYLYPFFYADGTHHSYDREWGWGGESSFGQNNRCTCLGILTAGFQEISYGYNYLSVIFYLKCLMI